tara:strand:+ start:85 stop:693 length:609 start_codon:yes stop_codon:yes gene_type:complete
MADLTFGNREIRDFRNKLTGGGARSNLFEVDIAYPTGLGADATGSAVNDGQFLIKAAEIPAANLGNIPVPFRGRVLPVAGDRTFDPWTVTIINDTNFVIRNAMEQWSNFINDIQTNQGEINPAAYQTSATVKQLSRKGKDEGKIDVLRTYKFEGIYPNAVSSIPLDYGATDQIEEFQVTFNYLFWEVADSKPAMTAKAQTTT